MIFSEVDPAPLVSVCMTTYNHEPFISKAIKSVLDQETAFPVELLIGEDGSSDLTGDIVRNFAAQFPDQIRPFYNDRSDVLYIGGHATGRRNLLNLLSHAQGKYIAILDGDDYWTDAAKLQMQVDLMERYPDVAMCFHDARIVDNKGQDTGRTFCNGELDEGDFEVQQMIERNKVHIGSALFRRYAILPPRAAEKIRTYDWLLVFIASEHGRLYYIDQLLSAYRVHSAGLWQKLSNLEQAQAEIDVLWNMNLFLKRKYHAAICESIANRICHLYRENQQKDTAPDLTLELLDYLYGTAVETRHALDQQSELVREQAAELGRIKNSAYWRLARRIKATVRKIIPEN